MSIRMEVPEPPRVGDQALEVRVRSLLLDAEAEMSQLQGDVCAQALNAQPVEDHLVLAHGRSRSREVGDRLAEKRRVRVQPGVVQPSQDGDALVERLACDEARGAEAHPVAVHETAQQAALGRPQDRRSWQRRQSCPHLAQAARAYPAVHKAGTTDACARWRHSGRESGRLWGVRAIGIHAVDSDPRKISSAKGRAASARERQRGRLSCAAPRSRARRAGR